MLLHMPEGSHTLCFEHADCVRELRIVTVEWDSGGVSDLAGYILFRYSFIGTAGMGYSRINELSLSGAERVQLPD